MTRPFPFTFTCTLTLLALLLLGCPGDLNFDSAPCDGGPCKTSQPLQVSGEPE